MEFVIGNINLSENYKYEDIKNKKEKAETHIIDKKRELENHKKELKAELDNFDVNNLERK